MDQSKDQGKGQEKEQKKDCSTCRHHIAEQREPLAFADPSDNVEDSMVAFDDENPQPYYFCNASEGPRKGQDIGFEPVHCTAYEPAKPVSPHVDALMTRFHQRHGKGGDGE